jgi:DNA replication and repair protein RecF
MFLKHLKLNNFTNYNELVYETDTFLNLIVGDNAQGKTNLLDAIYYLSNGSSYRYQQDQQLIKWDADFFTVNAETKNKYNLNKFSISYAKNKKTIVVNESKLLKIADLLGIFTVVFFSPDDLYIVKGNPSLRRKYLDSELCQVSPKYYYYLQQYKKSLLQRNRLLKEIRQKGFKKNNLDIWNIQIAKYGAWLIIRRYEMLKKIRPLARLTHRKLADGAEELEIIYKSSLNVKEEQFNLEELENYFISQLELSLDEDILKGFTGKGPHRDDFEVRVNGYNLKEYGSQGQQRTAALSLKISEVEFMYGETGEYPVLLLDDVLSELDKKRRDQLLKLVSDRIQTFITCTDVNFLNKNILEKAAIHKVTKGFIKKLK